MQHATAVDKAQVSGPNPKQVGHMLQLIYGRFVGEAVCLAAKLGIADLIVTGRDTTAKLAGDLDANQGSLRRFLKALASNGILAEQAEDHWKLTPTGELLRSDIPGSMRDLAGLFNTPEHANAWLAVEHSVLTGGCAFERVYGTGAWNYAQKHPEFNQAFNAAMSSVAGSVHQAIAHAYDFSGIDLLVDVGGGHGRLMAHLLARYPAMRGIVYDMPHVIGGAAAHLAERGLADRAEAVGGDFFDRVPSGADAYIMTAIIHDWDDERSEVILSNCRAAMKPGGRVLLGDFVLRPANEPDFGRLIDLEMLVMTSNGRERTEEEFRALLHRSGLRLNRIVPLPAGNSLIEAVRE